MKALETGLHEMLLFQKSYAPDQAAIKLRLEALEAAVDELIRFKTDFGITRDDRSA